MKSLDGIKPFEKRVWLSSPTMHGEELQFMQEAFESNWMSTVGQNINELERLVAEKIGCQYAVALSAGTAALHLATKLAGEKLYGQAKPHEGTLRGKKAFCSDLTFDASVNPVAYEDGEAVFIDTEGDTWNMDPLALEKAFVLYPDVKLIVLAHLYGTPGKLSEIKEIAKKHDALIIEDAAESFGAKYKGMETGNFGDYNAISFNGNKIITGSSGGMFLTNSREDADKVRKWSTQSREDAPWYEHEEIGYNYRMSNVIAGVVRGQMPYLNEHIERKKEIYHRYSEGLRDLPLSMNPYDKNNTEPNFWLSCILIQEDAMSPIVRGEREYLYQSQKGKSNPQEIMEMLTRVNAESRPIWKPMHMQPIYRMNSFVTREGNGRGRTNAYIDEGEIMDIGADIFQRGLCLPSDNKMTKEEQEKIMEVIKRAFA